MDKHWFIYRGDHHLGPFTFQEILDKVKLSEISDDELTWCEGNNDWLPAKEQPAIQNALFSQQKHALAKQKREQEKRDKLAAQKQAELVRRQAEQERIMRLKKEQELRERQELERQRELERQKRMEVERQAREKELERQRQLEAADEPPPLPPLPPEAHEEDVVFSSEESSQEIYQDELVLEDVPAEEPPPVVAREVAPEEEIVEEAEEAQSDLEEEYYEENFVAGDSEEYESAPAQAEVTGEHQVLREDPLEEGVSGARLYSALALSVLGLGLFVYLISQTFTGQRRLYNVAGRDKDALYNVMNRPFKGVPIHRMRATKDLNSLWLATNFPDQAILYMTLESIPGRTITPEDDTSTVQVQAMAKLNGGAALFEQLEVLKGDTLHVGEYRYVVRGTRVGLKGKLSDALGNKAVFKEMKFIRAKDQEFELKGTLLLSPYSQEKFEEKLKDHMVFVEKSVIRPLKDRLQRYITFMGLLERMNNLYKDVMKKITKGSSIKIFEDRYNEEVGPFLRDLIIDNNRLYLSLRNLQPKDSKAYEDLMNYGKDIGIIASEMVTKTRRVRKLSRSKTEYLLNNFGQKVQKLREQGQQEKTRIQNKLAPFVKSK